MTTKHKRPNKATRRRRAAENWRRATLSNDFLFNRVMKDKTVLLPTLRRLLPEEEITRLVRVNGEFNLKHSKDGRGFRLDILAVDDRRREFNIEMQVLNYHNLAPRSLAYFASIVEDQLEEGDHYQKLRSVHVIFLTNFDPLGHHCQYDTYRVLSTKRPHRRDLSTPPLLNLTFLDITADQEDTPLPLRRLCRFIRTGEVASVDSADPLILKLKQRQDRAKKNSEWRKIFMRIDFNRQDQEWALQEEHAKGMSQGISQGMSRGRAQGIEITREVIQLDRTGKTEAQIVTRLVDDFALSTAEAQDYYRQAMLIV